jgi:hypothetical protein
MLNRKRVAIVHVLNELISSLDTTLSHPEILDSQTDIGRVYLEVSKRTLSNILREPDSRFDTLFSDSLLRACEMQSQTISRLVGQAKLPDVLWESHKLLGQLPGKPPSEPRILPPPPEIV